jgi:hypothetical protein
MNSHRLAVVVSLALITAGCATATSQHKERWNKASDHADSVCKSPYKAGSCYEREVTKVYPEWVYHETAKSISLFYAFADAAGDRLQKGQWTREEYDNNLVQFSNRLQMDMAEKRRADDEAARQRFYAGLIRFNQSMANEAANRAKIDQANRGIFCQPWLNGYRCQ